MIRKITSSQMRFALLTAWEFVDQKWEEVEAKKSALSHLESAFEHWKKWEMWGEPTDPKRSKRRFRHLDNADAELQSAAKIEKMEVKRLQQAFLNSLYGGESKTPYSDAISAQKKMPDKEYIWAFRKMLEEYRKEVGG